MKNYDVFDVELRIILGFEMWCVVTKNGRFLKSKHWSQGVAEHHKNIEETRYAKLFINSTDK